MLPMSGAIFNESNRLLASAAELVPRAENSKFSAVMAYIVRCVDAPDTLLGPGHLRCRIASRLIKQRVRVAAVELQPYASVRAMCAAVLEDFRLPQSLPAFHTRISSHTSTLP